MQFNRFERVVLLTIIANARLKCEFDLGPALTYPAVRINLQLQSLQTFYDSSVQTSFHFGHENWIRSELLVSRYNEAFVVYVACISLKVDSEDTMVFFESLCYDLDISLWHPVVRYVHMHQRFIFFECISPCFCEHSCIVLLLLLNHVCLCLRLPLLLGCNFISVSLTRMFHLLQLRYLGYLALSSNWIERNVEDLQFFRIFDFLSKQHASLAHNLIVFQHEDSQLGWLVYKIS